MKAKQIISVLDKFCNPKLIDSWDNTGFQIGNDDTEVNKVLISLDLDERIYKKAVNEGYEMIITHHPIIFKPIKSINNYDSTGRMILKLISNNIVVYNAHTNLDLTNGGVNDVLAERLGIKNTLPLNIIKEEKLFKLIVYVPESHKEQLLSTLGEADAGHIGNYSHCTFYTLGEGRFKLLEGTNPFLGSIGSVEKVEEAKIETIVKEEKLTETIKKVIKIHPYEEVAYDIFEMVNEGESYGYGRVGEIDTIDADSFLYKLKEALFVDDIRVYGNTSRKISKIAVCGGSGGSFILDAYKKGAEVYITGDIKYHEAQLGLELGLIVVDAGHFHTEKLVLQKLKNVLEEQLNDTFHIDVDLNTSVFYKIY